MVDRAVDRSAVLGQSEPAVVVGEVYNNGDSGLVRESQRKDGIEVAEEGEPVAVLLLVAEQVAVCVPAGVASDAGLRSYRQYIKEADERAQGLQVRARSSGNLPRRRNRRPR